MALPQQKKFSLDEAVNYIQLETGVPHSKEGLFDLAKHGNFRIYFYVRGEDLKFIQLDKENDKWQSVPCAPLLGKDSLKKIVIPVENPNQENLFSMTLNPREERIFPILEGRALQQTADNSENEIITIMPWRVSATDSNTLLSIAIIKNRHINGNNSLDANKYIEWQKERDLPIYNPDIKTNSLIKPIVRHSDNGNFKYFETQSTMEIKRSDLCVTYKALENYIKTVRINNIKLDEPYYSLKDARTKIKEIAKKKVKPHNLIKLAESGKIRLSIHKPEWKYVRIDEQGQEMDIMPRKIPIDKGNTTYLIVPRSGLFKDSSSKYKKGLDAGTGTEAFSLLYGDSTDRTIYPFFDPKHFKSRTNDKKLYIYTHDMEAKYKNQTIKVSKVTYDDFPEKGDSNYSSFMEWLRENLSPDDKNIYLDDKGLLDHRMYFDSDNFYVLGGQWKGRGFEIAESDLVITRHELGDHILSIMDAPYPSLHLQETTKPSQVFEPTRTKPICKISLPIRIKEEMEAIEIESTETLIPHGRKAIIAKTISEDSEEKFNQKAVETKIYSLGYKSENQPRFKR